MSAPPEEEVGAGHTVAATACAACGAVVDLTARYCGRCGRSLPPISDDGKRPLPRGDSGTRPVGSILGTYRILQMLGEGGMGRVYLAEHTKLGRKVALKVLRSDYSGRPQAVRRFFAEAWAVNQIAHENIVEITDVVENESGAAYYIMELLEGKTLARALAEDTVLSIRRALEITVQIARALEAVHGANIIHRDLKPENIFLVRKAGRDDFVKLLDFGVAKLLDLGSGQPMDTTRSGILLGTPKYMSPEQAAGKIVDHRSDIYTLGVLLYEQLTGQRPMGADNFGDLVVKLMTSKPKRPSKIPDLPHKIPSELDVLIMECLESDPEQRPPNMSEVAARLRSMAETHSLEAEAVREVVVPHRRAGRWAAAVSVLLLIFAWTTLRLSSGSKERENEIQPPEPPVAAPAPPPAQNAGRLTFVTTPAGAEVFREGESSPIGRTPFSFAPGRSSGLLVFEIRLPGYASLREEVDLGAGDLVVRTLSEIKPQAPGPTRSKPRESRKTQPVLEKPAERPPSVAGRVDPTELLPVE